MLRINNIKIVPCDKFRFNDNGLSQHVLTEIKNKALKKLRINSERLLSLKVVKQSIDARKKDDVKVVFSVDVEIEDEPGFLSKYSDKDVVCTIRDELKANRVKSIKKDKNINIEKSGINRIIVVGAGPAGLFCALRLAYAGLKPLLLERGEDVDKRLNSVNDFWQGKPLNPSSNVQFGEGGAGTFSDGKLNTMVKDKDGYMKQVYNIFVENGADESILYINKPHIGTDKLKDIVKSIREKIIELGGEVRFSSQVVDIILDSNLKENDESCANIGNKLNGDKNIIRKVTSVKLADGSDLECDKLVLALGHSARDTFEMLDQKGIYMEQKPFAIGVRVQHPRQFIDKTQYGSYAEYLPAADYKLTYTREGKRSVYSFCMCPGGYVVNASSEAGRLTVNGMSYSRRDSKSSNSAIVVSVSPLDYPGDDPLAGMRMQRTLEEEVYEACNGKIPVQRLDDFVRSSFFKYKCAINSNDDNDLENENVSHYIDKICDKKVYFEDNTPECKGSWEEGDFNTFLPKYITESLLDAFPEFGRNIKGYNSSNTLLLGLESRTSSPIRICRGENLQSVNVSGLYPCGEGAGYAGGITSAAMDGLKVADKIIQSIRGTVL